MKKICFIILANIFVISFVFAQSAEFTNHLEKAKGYEVQKNFVSALGEYYDAMSVEKSLSGKDAYKSWEQLSEIIQSGKPGYGDFDEFTFVDEWIVQLQEFEKYWTENCPILIIYDLKRIQLNREDKTATYEMNVTWELSPKYKEIENIFKSGLEKAYTSDWQMPFLEKWPIVSVYNTAKDKNKFLQNGAALVQNITKYNNSGRYIYSEYKLVASLAEFGCIARNLAGYYDAYEPTTVYDLKLKLIDDTGKEIFSGKRLLLGPVSKYTFTVTQEQMQKIENKKVIVIPEAIFLQYGNIPTEPWITEDSREWIKSLSEINLNKNNVSIIFKEELNEHRISSVEIVKDIVEEYQKQESYRIREEEQQRLNEEEKRVERENYLRELEGILNSLTYTTSSSYPTSSGKYIVKTTDGITNAIVFFVNLFPEYVEKYGIEQISYAVRLVLCNEVSKNESLEQAYSISEKEQVLPLTDKILFCLDNINSINVNIKAKGYRIPEQKEKEYLKKYVNPQLFDYIIIRNK